MPFDRDKLMRSVEVALRKRPVDPERVERMVNGIVRQLESQGEAEIQSDRIGELVMEGAALARQCRLCALRLGLSQFPRGPRFQHADRRIRAGRVAGRAAGSAETETPDAAHEPLAGRDVTIDDDALHGRGVALARRGLGCCRAQSRRRRARSSRTGPSSRAA